MLEEDGFIVSGETEAELDRKDIRFSYAALEPKSIKKKFYANYYAGAIITVYR
jgi:hypothetical protein